MGVWLAGRSTRREEMPNRQSIWSTPFAGSGVK
jgi:hypothetical protein